MGRRGFPTNNESKTDSVVCSEVALPTGQSWLGMSASDYDLSEVVASGQSLALLERIATQAFGSQARESEPLTVPLLGHLVPGAESCAIFFFDRAKRQLRLEAAANLSPEFVSALVNRGEVENLMISAAEQAKPYALVYLPGNKQFKALGKVAHREGIRTLWLIPWRDAEGSALGLLLFASAKAFSPSKEALASVTLLTAWMSTALGKGNAKSITDALEAVSEAKTGMGAAGAYEAANIDQLLKELATSREERTRQVHSARESNVARPSRTSTGVKAPFADIDKHGIPVIYDSAFHEQKNSLEQPDAVSVLSHELLSPLTLIKGYTATLIQLNDVITEEQKGQYVKGIETATNRVIRLLENLRDIARIEEADTVIVEPISLPDVLRQIVSEMQSQTTKHIIKLRTFNPLPAVRVDQHKIEQVLTNLLVNAVKYSPQGGDIETSVRLLRNERELKEIFERTPALKLPSIIVSVADSGIGIPEEELSRLFQRFYRVDNKLTRITPGAGLGLYICRMIVETHGGCIWAGNREAGGSVFSFSLPVD